MITKNCKRLISFTLLTLSVLLADTSAEAGGLAGIVTDPDGKPLANAIVAANAMTLEHTADGDAVRHITRTDAYGRFVFPELPGGVYGATVTFPHLAPVFAGKLLIPADGVLDKQTFQLGRGGATIEGALRVATGTLPDGLVVAAERISTDQGDLFFGEIRQGRFQLSLSPGQYIVAARAPGWSSIGVQKTIAVADRTIALDMPLHREHGSAPLLAAEIEAMEAADQDVRNRWIQSQDAAHQQQMAEVDAKNEAKIKEIIREHGWPSADLVGQSAVHATWVLVQHASPALLKACLPGMKAAADRGELPWSTVALSIDRDLVHDGKKQLYGSQVDSGTAREIVLYPVEDEAHLDERRAKVGLGTIAEYKAELLKLYQPAPAGK
jgi:hypothetical protein